MTLEIDTPAKKERLISLLEGFIDTDCTEGKRFIAQKEASGEAAGFPPFIMDTLKKNVEVREKTWRGLIEKLQKHKGAGVTFEDFYTEFVLSVAKATHDDDKYHELFFSMIRRDDVPEDVRKGMVNQTGQSMDGKVLTAYVPKDTSPEELKAIPIRHKTIQRVIHLSFEAFYLAASEKKEVVRTSPDFQKYAQTVNERVFAPNDLSR